MALQGEHGGDGVEVTADHDERYARTARELADAFESAQRPGSDDACGIYYRLREGSPDWMQAAVRLAHGDMLPDDWKYEHCGLLACSIAEHLEYEPDLDILNDTLCEIVDGLVDIYTSALTAWLASHLDRVEYVQRGNAELGVTDPDDIAAMLMRGQYVELYEMADGLVAAIRERADEAESADTLLAESSR